MFCCLVLCDVISVVLLLVMIVWLNSQLNSHVCEVVYMVWDIQWVVMCGVCVCIGWATMAGEGRPEWGGA